MDNFYTRLMKGILNEKVSMPSPYPNTNKFVSKFQTADRSFNSQQQAVAAAMSATYTSACKSREEYTREFENIKGHYLTYALLSNMSEDALTPDVSSGDILRIVTDNEDCRDELERFQKEFNLDGIVNDFIYDLLSYGEYALRLVIEPGQGVVEILDNVPIGSVVGFYKQGYPFKFMVKDGKKVLVQDPSAFAHFILSSNKLNLPTFAGLTDKQMAELPQEVKDLPSHVRIGRPVLFGVISKMKELDLLEKIVPATRLADIMAASIISVEVPAQTDPQEAFNIAGIYENLFNKKVTLTDSGQLTATDILTQAGRTKVVPTWQGKGGMSNVDVRTSATDANIMDNIRDTRDVICTSIGFPTELLYGGASRSEIIKKYARYLRKVKSIQNAIAFGIIQLCIAHFTNLEGYENISVSDFEVEFMNETVNIDELEKLEYHDAVISFIRNTFSFLADLANAGYDDLVNDEKLRKWMSDKLEFIDYEADEEQGSDFDSGAGDQDPTKIGQGQAAQLGQPGMNNPDLDNFGGQPNPQYNGGYMPPQ